MARELDIKIKTETTEAERALQRVEEGLTHIGESAVGAGESLEKTKEALGGNTSAVERMTGSVAQAVPGLGRFAARLATPGGIGVAVVSALAMGARVAGDFGKEIEQLSKRSRMGSEAVETLGFVAKRHGTTFTALSNELNEFDKKVLSGAPKIVNALDGLGLSTERLMKLKPEDRLRELARALSGIPDPAQQADYAFTLLGSNGVTLIDLFRDIAQGAEDNAPRMSEAWIRANARLRKDLDELMTKTMHFMKWLGGLPALAIADTFPELYLQHLRTMTPPDVSMLKAPLGFDPGYVPVPDPFNGPVGGVTLDYWDRELKRQLAATKQTAKVLPFERPQLFGEDWGSYLSLQAAAYNNPSRWNGTTSGSLQLGPGTFPGWAPLSSTWAGDGLPMAAYPGAVPMNRPNVGPGLLSGTTGRFFGTGLGLATSFIPGMSQPGSLIGGSVGGALGGLKSVTGLLGSFAPFLGPVAGIAGGLLGKLFGGGEGDKTRDKRTAFLDEFGGLDALEAAAEKAGFSIDKLMSTKKVADFDAEVRKLEQSMAAYDAQVKEAEKDVNDLYRELDATLQKGAQLGYNFDQQGNLVSVSFEKMQEAAKRLGIDVDSLGSKFQADRIHADASTLINDFELLAKGGADMGAMLFGAREEISRIVADSRKFGTEIPANMQPWVHELVRSGNVLTENRMKANDLAQNILDMGRDIPPALRDTLSGFIQTGDLLNTASGEAIQFTDLMQMMGASSSTEVRGLIDKLIEMGLTIGDTQGELTDLSGLRFGEPIQTQFEELQTSIQALVEKIGEMVAKLDELTRPRTIDVSWNVQAPPDIPNPEYSSLGGFVGRPHYFGVGGFVPRGTDTVPAMLTPGEGVLRREAVSRLMRGDWPSGGGLTVSIGHLTVDAGAGTEAEFETRVGRAVVQGLKRRGVRLNAA